MNTRLLVLVFALAACGSVPLAAQSPAPNGGALSPAERATVARDAWRRAGASQRAQLPDSMWADMNRAHAAWPPQVAYSEMVARQSARRGNTAALERVLRRLATQGMGAGAAADTSVARVAATTPGGTAALAALKSAVAHLEASTPRQLLGDTAFFPEGIDVDPSDGTLYIASIHHRTVRAFKRDGTSRTAINAEPGAIAGAFGVAVDRARGALWVTTGGIAHMKDFTPADSARAELLRVKLSDGTIEQRWRLGDGTGTPGEIAVNPTGDVLVSDAIKGRLYRLRGGKGALSTMWDPLESTCRHASLSIL